MRIQSGDLKKALSNRVMEFFASSGVKKEVNQCIADAIDPWVPYDTGALANRKIVTDKGIVYTQPYADEQYHGININHNTEHHPLATAYWDQVAMQTNGDAINAEIKKILQKGLSSK